MEFDAGNITAIIIAILMGIPSIGGWINKLKEGNVNYQDKLRELTDVNVSLLSILIIYDTLLQRIFASDPEINGDLRMEWIRANSKLKELRERMVNKS